MTPRQKIIKDIILDAVENGDFKNNNEITSENIEQIWQQMRDEDIHWDYMSEYRHCGTETGIKCEFSRYYESKSVACETRDGEWIGWTYWYGGGKHSAPEEIDWMSEAYEVEVKEYEKMVTVQEFKKKH